MQLVERAIAAINLRDLDATWPAAAMMSSCANPLLAGYTKAERGIKRFLADIEDAGPDLRIEIHRVEVIGCDRAIAVSAGQAPGTDREAGSFM